MAGLPGAAPETVGTTLPDFAAPESDQPQSGHAEFASPRPDEPPPVEQAARKPIPPPVEPVDDTPVREPAPAPLASVEPERAPAGDTAPVTPEVATPPVNPRRGWWRRG